VVPLVQAVGRYGVYGESEKNPTIFINTQKDQSIRTIHLNSLRVIGVSIWQAMRNLLSKYPPAKPGALLVSASKAP
jgi:hypothetical protein